MTSKYIEVTELSNESASEEQIARAISRYQWALPYCENKDVLELACGSGPGLGLIQSKAKSLIGADISGEILNIAKGHYKERIVLRTLDACQVDLADQSFDTVILFEALYYLKDPNKFIDECIRLIKPNGFLLIAIANKDLYDFSPSKYSYNYYGVVELNSILTQNGFTPKFWGNLSVDKISSLQKMLRPVKKLAVSCRLMPQTFAGKQILKRIVFGKLAKFPAEITPDSLLTRLDLESIPNHIPNSSHKVIFCAAQKGDQNS